MRITKIKTKKQKVRREPYLRESKSEVNLLGKKGIEEQRLRRKGERFQVARVPQRSSLSRKRGYSFSGERGTKLPHHR